MTTELFNNEAINIWKKVAGKSDLGTIKIDFDLHRKILKLFQVSECFYWIFNLEHFHLDLVSNDVSLILGYRPSEFTFESLMDSIHPEDRPYFLNFENRAREFLSQLPIEKLMKYKVRHDFRVKAKSGSYIRLLHQALVLQHNEQGHILKTLGIETDITTIKKRGNPELSFIGLDDEPSYIDVDVQRIFTVGDKILTKREKQVLLLIMKGKVSKEISEILYIGKQTVDSHRNNMIKRNGLKNTSELIAKAMEQGWI